jgi:uncharacterized protein with HEPN domain
MRSEKLYLADMLEAADDIARFLAGMKRDVFMRDELRQSAILHKLLIIGEAAARLSSELRDRYPDVPWRDIVGFRNTAIHAYFAVDLAIVWVTATQDVPELRQQVARILAREYSDKPGEAEHQE